MSVETQISDYIARLPEAKRSDMEKLHRNILATKPGCKLCFFDGRNDEGKVVSNPNIGYGTYTVKRADGSSSDFYRVDLSANISGISVYIMGLDDKKYLSNPYASDIGKASNTRYCIKFKKLEDINAEILEIAVRSRLAASI